MSRKSECVRVIIRARPLNAGELAAGCSPIITINRIEHEIILSRPSEKILPTTPTGIFAMLICLNCNHQLPRISVLLVLMVASAM